MIGEVGLIIETRATLGGEEEGGRMAKGVGDLEMR